MSQHRYMPMVWGIVILALSLLFALALQGFAIGGGPKNASFAGWAYDFQTLIGGMLALLGGIFVLVAAREGAKSSLIAARTAARSARENTRREIDDNQRRDREARATDAAKERESRANIDAQLHMSISQLAAGLARVVTEAKLMHERAADSARVSIARSRMRRAGKQALAFVGAAHTTRWDIPIDDFGPHALNLVALAAEANNVLSLREMLEFRSPNLLSNSDVTYELCVYIIKELDQMSERMTGKAVVRDQNGMVINETTEV